MRSNLYQSSVRSEGISNFYLLETNPPLHNRSDGKSLMMDRNDQSLRVVCRPSRICTKANLRMCPNSHPLCFGRVGGFSAFPSHSNPHNKSHHTSLPNQWKSYAFCLYGSFVFSLVSSQHAVSSYATLHFLCTFWTNTFEPLQVSWHNA